LGDVGDGQNLNRYAFVSGNPVSFIDPFGLYSWGAFGNDAYGAAAWTLGQAWDWTLGGPIDQCIINPNFVGCGVELFKPAKVVKKSYKCGEAVYQGTKNVNPVISQTRGKVGEVISDMDKTKQRIWTGTTKSGYRYPDKLTRTTLEDSKNVSYLSDTRQLRDYHGYAQYTNRDFIIHVRPNTRLSRPLQQKVQQGNIQLRDIYSGQRIWYNP